MFVLDNPLEIVIRYVYNSITSEIQEIENDIDERMVEVEKNVSVAFFSSLELLETYSLHSIKQTGKDMKKSSISIVKLGLTYIFISCEPQLSTRKRKELINLLDKV